MFNFFGKKAKLLLEDDRIFINRQAADRFLVIDAAALATAAQPAFICSFFSGTLHRIGNQLRAAGTPFSTVDIHALPRIPLNGIPALQLLDAGHLRSLSFQSWLLNSGKSLSFIFVEHYPFLSAEKQVLDMLEQVSQQVQQRVRFYGGLDDRMFKAFGGERIVSLMQKMGMEQDQPIMHSMVSKSIENAQKRIEKKVGHESSAATEEEWFIKNMPG